MMLVELTDIPSQDLPIAAFRDHLRLPTGFGDDSLQDGVLEASLRAAIAAIEARTGKVLFQRDFRWSLTAWRTTRQQALPVAPVQALTGLKMLSRAGEETVIDADRVRLVRDAQRPMLCASGAMLPGIPSGGSVEVSFSAGYGAGWDDLPADLRQAVFLLAARYYELRHDEPMGGGAMPFGVTALIERYRTIRVLGSAR
ncbi:MAG: hypothetical protein ACK5IB_07795 [Qingshengfaniella sp.]